MPGQPGFIGSKTRKAITFSQGENNLRNRWPIHWTGQSIPAIVAIKVVAIIIVTIAIIIVLVIVAVVAIAVTVVVVVIVLNIDIVIAVP